MVQIDLTLIASVINFFLLAWLLQRVLYKPVQNLLQERQKTIEEKLAAAAERERRAASKEEEYEQHLAESKKEAQKVLKSATQQGEALKQEILAKAKKQAAEIIAQAQRQAQEEQAQLWQHFRGEVGKVAIELAEKVVGELDEEHYQKLMDNIISQLDPNTLGEPK